MPDCGDDGSSGTVVHMMSDRPTDATVPETRDAILDAVREQVLRVGVRRATFADVARRTGMSRSTLYRYFPDVETAVAELLTRELTALLSGVGEDVEAPDGRRRLAAAAQMVVRRLAEHPVMRQVLDIDPELLLPYMIDRLGSTQQASVEMITAYVRDGQVDGSIRPGDPKLLAYCLHLTVQSFVLSNRITEQEADPDKVLAELGRMVDAYLRPDPT